MAYKLNNREKHHRVVVGEVTLRGKRAVDWTAGMRELPALRTGDRGIRNGEALATDEASVWKRVLNYRVAKAMQPRRLIESHPGVGISSEIYRIAAPRVVFGHSDECAKADLVDIDPFGDPWEDIERLVPLLSPRGVIMITSGEIISVIRHWPRAQRFATSCYGKAAPRWVLKEHLPRLEKICRAKVYFFYAFPTSVRVILSRQRLPRAISAGCPQWMWWLDKYAHE